MRRTKIICTIGPKTSSYETIEKMAEMGMDIARLNFSHGTRESHAKVIKAIKTINSKGVYSIAIMLDTKGPEVRTGDLATDISIRVGDEFTFLVGREPSLGKNETVISDDGFIKEIEKDDVILIDAGILAFKVKRKTKTDILTECIDGGKLRSRRHVNIRGKTSKLPSITKEDWKDIDFGISEGVDFIALSFVKNAEAVMKLRSYLDKKKAPIDIIAKIESAQAVDHIEEIIKVSDGVMVARGDLGAEMPLEEVPILQEEMVERARALGKPVIVATHLLESMIENPTPTRAEVADIASIVEQGVDCVMLSGETATGNFPLKAISVLDRVARRIEKKQLENKQISLLESNDHRIELVRSACIMANNLDVNAILVFTRRGTMATFVSRCRPHSPIFAFTNMTSVRRRLNLYWGVTTYRIEFSENPEKTIQRAMDVLKRRKLIKKNDRVIVVSDILAGKEHVETVQIRKIG
ncbi:pyruvate kinase [Candidatus Gottesmanbacteria bacterium]|nr:pyruvate kinase [Candidatus Gottesmanbacteria bacterium]